jgi:peptidyl-prolyl cis-trans isomerase C
MSHRLFGLFLAAALTAGTATVVQAETAADPVVARVNGREIHQSDVKQLASQLPAQVQSMPMEMIYPAILEQLVNGALIAEAGYSEKLQDSAEVKAELKRAEERAVQHAYIDRKVAGRITPDMLAAHLKEFQAEHPPQDEVKASHILVESEAEAKDIIAKLKGGADFAQLAKDKSKDKAAAAQGGDLGYFTKDAMVGPFADAAFAMKPGEVSATPVQTQFGWHVIKVEDHRAGAPVTLDEMRPQIEKELAREIVQKTVEDLRTKAKVETFQIDGSPMPAQPAQPAKK